MKHCGRSSSTKRTRPGELKTQRIKRSGSSCWITAGSSRLLAVYHTTLTWALPSFLTVRLSICASELLE